MTGKRNKVYLNDSSYERITELKEHISHNCEKINIADISAVLEPTKKRGRKSNTIKVSDQPPPSPVEAVLDGGSVRVDNPHHIAAIYTGGYFGKGSVSRGKPSAVSDQEETLILTPVEALYLMTHKVITIMSDVGRCTKQKLWCTWSNDPLFPHKYAVFEHFRAKGWVVRSGLKYGADYILYQDGPCETHASYAVKCFSAECTPDWNVVNSLRRVNETVAKELVLCYVAFKGSMTYSGCVKSCDVTSIILKRWLPERDREAKLTKTQKEKNDEQNKELSVSELVQKSDAISPKSVQNSEELPAVEPVVPSVVESADEEMIKDLVDPEQAQKTAVAEEHVEEIQDIAEIVSESIATTEVSTNNVEASIENIEKTEVSTENVETPIENMEMSELSTENVKTSIENIDKSEVSTEHEEMSIVNMETSEVSTENVETSIDTSDISTENAETSIENIDKSEVSTENNETSIENMDTSEVSTENVETSIKDKETSEVSTENVEIYIEDIETSEVPIENIEESIGNKDTLEVSTENVGTSIENIETSEVSTANVYSSIENIETSEESTENLETSIENIETSEVSTEDVETSIEIIESPDVSTANAETSSEIIETSELSTKNLETSIENIETSDLSTENLETSIENCIETPVLSSENVETFIENIQTSELSTENVETSLEIMEASEVSTENLETSKIECVISQNVEVANYLGFSDSMVVNVDDLENVSSLGEPTINDAEEKDKGDEEQTVEDDDIKISSQAEENFRKFRTEYIENKDIVSFSSHNIDITSTFLEEVVETDDTVKDVPITEPLNVTPEMESLDITPVLISPIKEVSADPDSSTETIDLAEDQTPTEQSEKIFSEDVQLLDSAIGEGIHLETFDPILFEQGVENIIGDETPSESKSELTSVSLGETTDILNDGYLDITEEDNKENIKDKDIENDDLSEQSNVDSGVESQEKSELESFDGNKAIITEINTEESKLNGNAKPNHDNVSLTCSETSTITDSSKMDPPDMIPLATLSQYCLQSQSLPLQPLKHPEDRVSYSDSMVVNVGDLDSVSALGAQSMISLDQTDEEVNMTASTVKSEEEVDVGEPEDELTFAGSCEVMEEEEEGSRKRSALAQLFNPSKVRKVEDRRVTGRPSIHKEEEKYAMSCSIQ